MTSRQRNQQRMGKIAQERSYKMKRKPTAAESIFRSLLKKYMIGHKFQKVIFTPKMFYILDFWIKTSKRHGIVIEIDGPTHNPEYDRIRDTEIVKQRGYRGYKIIRIKNEQVFSGEADDIIKTLFAAKIARAKRSREKWERKHQIQPVDNYH